MKEHESPRFLASGQWVEQETTEQPGSLLSRLRRRRERKRRFQTSWEQALTLHDEIFARWSEYELDVAKLIDYPAMTDLREPPTAAMIRAMHTAQRLRPAAAAGHSQDAFEADYGKAVREFEEAFLLAENEAKRIKRGHYTAAEQQRLQTARQLLNIATNDSSSPSERQAAYRRLRKTVEGLLRLPEQALSALEQHSTGSPPPS